MPGNRRRIDEVLAADFLRDLASLDVRELRARRDQAESVEGEISYYRRLLHGRMDLLDFELRRRRGEEERSLLEALPEILASGMILGSEPTMRHLGTTPPIPETAGRRLIDKVMDDGILTRLPELTDEELVESMESLREVETALSSQRKRLHTIIDRLQDEIVSRYRSQHGGATAAG